MISNDEVAGFVAQAPARLIGVGSVNLARPMEAVREIRRCIGELGFKAIRVLPWLWEVPPTDRRFYPVYTACADLGVPFCTQIGHTGPLMPSEVGRPIYLDQVALDFPELAIVGGHIGYPWTEEAVAVATKHENVFIDTSAYVARRYPGALVEFMRGHGRHKVLFGSNYPMIMPARALDGVAALGLDEESRAMFLAGNASKVFGLE
jgi:predicted TIM-barrel fold metal-dependent hydrolase